MSCPQVRCILVLVPTPATRVGLTQSWKWSWSPQLRGPNASSIACSLVSQLKMETPNGTGTRADKRTAFEMEMPREQGVWLSRTQELRQAGRRSPKSLALAQLCVDLCPWGPSHLGKKDISLHLGQILSPSGTPLHHLLAVSAIHFSPSLLRVLSSKGLFPNLSEAPSELNPSTLCCHT